MVFSSNLFLFFFLPLVLAAYYLCPARFRPHLLTVFGLFFYGWSNPLFVFLMLFTTSVDYIAGVMMAQGVPGAATSDTVYPALPAVGERTPAQKAALFISISCNLGLLGFFKYFNFGIEAMQQLAGAFGMTALAQGPVLHVALPLGISFYTFQSMSYTIDVYRGHVAALKNFPLFISYVTMFPQLVAGPIIRFRDVNDQILRRTHTMEKFTRGIAFFSIGLAKKVILGNPCGRIADTCFDAASLSTLEAWTGMLAYSLQIYFDFSGYSDMAVGLGLMIGFILPKNFNSPYRSLGVTDFWRRWHITLSTWLRLPLRHARWQPQRPGAHLCESLPRHAARRPVAWSELEFHHLGRGAWPVAGRGAFLLAAHDVAAALGTHHGPHLHRREPAVGSFPRHHARIDRPLLRLPVPHGE